MNKFKKITISTILCMIMIVSLATMSFADQVVYEKMEDEVISNGVTYKNVLRFGRNGWLNINALYVDLDDTSTRLEIVQSPEGLSHRESLSQMVSRYDNVIGAINGDFFHVTTPAAPTGVVVKDGKLISSPEPGGSSLATLFISNNNQAWVDYWKFNLSIVTDKGNTIHLGNINKFSKNYLDIALIDRNWGTHSPGFAEYYEDITEVVVIDDVVTEVRRKQPSVEIPEDGYIILATQSQAPGLFDNLEVGDRLIIKQDLGKNIEDIKIAIGGGTALVKDGEIVSLTQSVSGAHPRTAIGITQDRTQLILVTIDGRHTSYKGVDGRQLAEMMIELGSYEAIIMDGGGSTTMMKRSPGELEPGIINHPSDGVERKIINGIAVVSTAPADGLGGIKAGIDNEKIFVGTPYKIDVKAFDKNYNPIKINYSRVNFSLKSGEGNFSGTNFIPTKPGKTVIGVEYLGAVSEIVVDVLSPYDSQEGTVTKDDLNKPYEIEGEKLFIHSGVQLGNYTLLDRIVTNKISSLINNNFVLSLFTGRVDPKLGNNIKKQMISAEPGHNSMEWGDNLIIQLDNSKDGIRQTDFDQWPWLQNLISTTNKKNIFVVMSKPIFGEGGFTDKLEANLLMDMLADLSEKGKYVFVFYEGKNISVDIVNGVRYISTGVYNCDILKNPQEIFKYIEFNINDKETTYQIRSLFE